MSTRVAFDVGPLAGARTGIAEAVAQMATAIALLDDAPELLPYLTSFRAPVEAGRRRLPLPAALAHRLWAHVDRPRCDRWLGRPDVVHGTNYVVPPARAARLVTVYDCWFLEHGNDVHPDVMRAGLALRRAVRDGATVHASSHATAAKVRALLDPARVEVIHLGAPPPRPRVAPAVDAPMTIAALGTVERRKNLPRLVAAFGQIADEFDDSRLVIAGGPGDDSVAVAEAIGALPPSTRHRVDVRGRVSDLEREHLLATATVLAYPSLDEGFGFPVLEAMAVGLPVVASTAGSIPEVAGDAALLVASDDVDALAAALRSVVTSASTRNRMTEAGLEQVGKFAWSTTAQRLAGLYADLAMERSR